MADLPILFSAPMVRALLDGRKTQTRRVIKDAPTEPGWHLYAAEGKRSWLGPNGYPSMPFIERFAKGDRLWVRSAYDCFPVYFKPIGFGGGKYAAGTDGNIYAMNEGAPRVCKAQVSKKGQLRISLRSGGAKFQALVHTLIAEAFYGPAPPALPLCRHIDGDLRNNRPDNLDWSTMAQKHADMHARGYGVGENCPSAKLTNTEAAQIKASDLPHDALASLYGVSRSAISMIKSGKRWQDLERLHAPRNTPAWKPWRPGIHMPRWASPLTLTVTDVRVQRLQEIGEGDAIAEGLDREMIGRPDGSARARWFGVRDVGRDLDPVRAYADLWDSINGAGAWARNDWIVALTFTVEKRNIDA